MSIEGDAFPDPRREAPFRPEVLDRTVIALPLLKMMREEALRVDELKKRSADKELLSGKELKRLQEADQDQAEVYPVIIELNQYHNLKQRERRLLAWGMVETVIGEFPGDERMAITSADREDATQYIFARLTAVAIRRLAELAERQESPTGSQVKNVPGDAAPGHDNPVRRVIHHIWPDFPIKPLVNKTIATVKADAAQKAFGAFGTKIVWAVMDSGVDKDHPHFQGHENLNLPEPLEHKSFCGGEADKDEFGHGTHVAGIIAGETVNGPAVADPKTPSERMQSPIVAFSRRRSSNDDVVPEVSTDIPRMSGMAPEAKILSLKVLDENGDGLASSLIAALEYVQMLNGYGRRVLVHGVNMSVGYDFEPEWFACGQSPLCVEVDRLVRSGVVVVVAAGNTGYGSVATQARGIVAAGIGLTINDPGNADLAITVGSTHRDMPHTYGVSYFSSKGPTGDGRLKPDLVAPGEKILSCAAGKERTTAQTAAAKANPPIDRVDFVEMSGTSMAAPHVSGVAAAFLSIRSEFIGQPERVKDLLMSTATDLRRERTFQGSGLIDLMRAIQSV